MGYSISHIQGFCLLSLLTYLSLPYFEIALKLSSELSFWIYVFFGFYSSFKLLPVIIDLLAMYWLKKGYKELMM